MPSSRPSPSRRPSDPWAAAVDHLRAADPRWHPLIERIGPCRLRPRADRFGILVRAIVGQQISTKAAASINQRLLDLQGTSRHRADALLGLGEAGIRTAGLSGVKSRYVLNLAEAEATGALGLARIGRLADEAIIRRLTAIKGIGRWTAEMFLIFSLNRPDVLPIGDLGVRVGIRDHHGLAEIPPDARLAELAEPWRPYRTVAMWYLWQNINIPPEPA